MKVICKIFVMASLAAAGSWAGEPGGTPDALFFTEAAAGGAVGVACFVAGYAVGGDPKKNAGTAREKTSYAVYGAAPVASALTVYVVGETAGLRSRNRAACLFATTGVSVAVTGAAAAAAYLFTPEEKDAGALTAALYSILPTAFLNAVVYNAVKEPYFAPIPGFSFTVTPRAEVVAADGAVRPGAGIVISF